MANPLNNSFENWDSPGTPGSSSGVCQNWTDVSVNGGTSTRQTDAPSGGDTYSVNIRSSAAAPVNSIGAIISDAFSLENDYITFYAKFPDSDAVECLVRLYNSSDVLIGEGVVNYAAAWTQYYIDVSQFKGQSVKIKFEQHTLSAGAGYATYIDLVVCTDSSSGTALFFSKSPNIAKDKTASASTYEAAENGQPANAIDDTTATRWYQQYGQPKANQWWKVDLDESIDIEDILITLYDIGGNTLIYTIKGSNNDSDWTTLIDAYTHSGNYSVIRHNISPPQEFRYIKIDTFDGTLTNARLNEVRIYQFPSPTKQQTITSDAKIRVIGQQQTITSDALITTNIIKTILSDAKIKIVGDQKTLTSDAKVVDRYQETILSDARILATIQETILSDAKIAIPVLYDVNNKITILKQVLSDINNKFTFVKRILSDINNIIITVKSLLYDIDNDFRMKKQGLYDATNDIRFLLPWQVPGDAGFQSLGKEYIKVYINSVEQTDVDVNSVRISKLSNAAHTASFILGRAYDSTKPDVESEVEIKYNDWLLFSGYITNIQPSDTPESMSIVCQNEYWKQNRTNKYFLIGHAPSSPREVYYPTIYGALNGLFGWNINIGKFTPDTIDLFGVGYSDCISTLVQESGNFGFYYDENKTKKLWTAGSGNIINLERQSIGTNLGLYQVISHRFTENVDDIVNKYRVQMGDLVIKRYNPIKTNKNVVDREIFDGYAIPAWDAEREIIVNTENPEGYQDTGFGWNYPESGGEHFYSEIFTKYDLPSLDSDLESWDDEKQPLVKLEVATDLFFGWVLKNAPENTGTESFPQYILNNGFTIDYVKKTLTLNDNIHLEKYNDNDELIAIKAPIIKLKLWKKKEYPHTDDVTDDPEVTISNPLMFFTPKIGDYTETIIKNLNLSNLSIQIGGVYYNPESKEWITYPTWNDSGYAMDYAKWLLSKSAYKQISGTVDITLDASCFHNIDLAKRIYIEGITESAMNIISMEYDLGSFTVSLQLENSHYYKRTVSLPWRGE